jgi:DNA-binding NtrC family response regulator
MEQALLNIQINEILLRSGLDLLQLTERKECIKPLCYVLLKDLSQKFQKDIFDFTPEALHFLTSYHWPGKIVQLRNILERAVILEESSRIHLQSIYFPEFFL